jgi:hypothetical protein
MLLLATANSEYLQVQNIDSDIQKPIVVSVRYLLSPIAVE